MFFQIPVFVALFNILYMTIELRQAPFILWVKDLSVQDPYYVLPILMGVTMFIQQKIQPTTMDPKQAQIMLLLPVFLTFLFITFPAGLVLYWLTNNVLTIAQQVITDRYLLPDRKSTRLNSSHDQISYAVFCLKKKKNSDKVVNIQLRDHGTCTPSR